MKLQTFLNTYLILYFSGIDSPYFIRFILLYINRTFAKIAQPTSAKTV